MASMALTVESFMSRLALQVLYLVAALAAGSQVYAACADLVERHDRDVACLIGLEKAAMPADCMALAGGSTASDGMERLYRVARP